MRTRRTYYRDYGISEEEKEKLKSICRNLSDMDVETQNILWQAAEASNKYISKHIFRSLTERLSYEDLQKEEYIPYGKEDFYGYQRLCISYFKNLMIFAGKYNQ